MKLGLRHPLLRGLAEPGGRLLHVEVDPLAVAEALPHKALRVGVALVRSLAKPHHGPAQVDLEAVVAEPELQAQSELRLAIAHLRSLAKQSQPLGRVAQAGVLAQVHSGQHRLGPRVALFCGSAVPTARLDFVLCHGLPEFVHPAKVELGHIVVCLGGLGEPMHGGCVVRYQVDPFLVPDTESVLCFHVPHVRGGSQPSAFLVSAELRFVAEV
mmetsp:Transcript_42396/g.113424  ORF Transcript_42396/g.113424 Transcript_42396/m.113424 type:complete len:213 (-) Transcript_42396:455-1093(-)